MANASQLTINLNKKSSQKVETVFLTWAVNSGKIVIIITELIALGALLYRFVVDKQIVDLHDQIKREQLFLTNQASKEKEYRGIQNRLAVINTISSDSNTKLQIMRSIIDAQNAHIFSDVSISVSQNIFTINGVAISIFSLNNFVDSLKTSPAVTSIGIDEITTSNQGIQFKMNVELTQPKL